MKTLTHDQKELILNAVSQYGTVVAGAKAAGLTVADVHNEMKHSSVFKKRISQARQEGRIKMADQAFHIITAMAMGQLKGDKNQLTAAIAINNAYEPGFKGTSRVEGRIDHNVRVLTAIPRPQYNKIIEVDKEQYQLDKDKLKQLNAGTLAPVIPPTIQTNVLKQ